MNAKGFPDSVKSTFQKSDISVFSDIEFIAGLVEHEVPLPGGGHPSQNDILVIAKTKKELAIIAVKGKVSEPFGETVGEWLKNSSKGKNERLKFLSELLGINL